MTEIWKPVQSYKGVMASSLGRIKLPPRVAAMPHGGTRTYTPAPRYGVVCKANKHASHTYMGIYNKFYGNMKVHRLVCEAFHGPQPKGMPVVIHIDENALNNRPENLKWGTQKENLNMPKFIAYCKGRTGAKSPRSKAQGLHNLTQPEN